MRVRPIAAKLIAALLLVVGASLSLPVYSQTIAYPPPLALGMASVAQLGAQASAMNPAIRCAGGRSSICGVHSGSRPILAGALIGALIGALSTPLYYEVPLSPGAGSAQQNSPVGTSIADSWRRFGETDPDARASARAASEFIERWQRFFEPSK
jgi:hypothetical protein